MIKKNYLSKSIDIINNLGSEHIQIIDSGDWLLFISCRLPEALKPSINYLQKTDFNSVVIKDIREPGTYKVFNLLNMELNVACSHVVQEFPFGTIQSNTQAIKDIFGGLLPGHGFTCECDTYLRQTETQIVSAISEVLKAQNRSKAESLYRIKGFLKALDCSSIEFQKMYNLQIVMICNIRLCHSANAINYIFFL